MTDADGSDWPPVGYVHKRHIHLPFNDQYDTDQPIVGARRTEVYNEEDDIQVINKLAASYERRISMHTNAVMEAERKLALYKQFGEDVYENGEVFSFQKRFGGGSNIYDYVVVKVHDEWYISGPREGGRSKTWIQLLAFIVEGNTLEDIQVYRVSEWEPIL